MIKLLNSQDIFADPRAAALLAEYAAECSIPIIGPIDPQPTVYAALERGGFAQCFGAFDGEKLVGFAMLLMTILPHYGRKVGTVESLFVSKDHRSGGFGAALMEDMNRFARQAGCEVILYSAPSDGALEKLMNRSKGYICTNAVFAKRLY